jgi:hypothetical protein
VPLQSDTGARVRVAAAPLAHILVSSPPRYILLRVFRI